MTGLGWGTVKQIVTRRLERDYGHPRLKDLEHLSIDEIYLGRRRKYRKPRTTGRFPELAKNF